MCRWFYRRALLAGLASLLSPACGASGGPAADSGREPATPSLPLAATAHESSGTERSIELVAATAPAGGSTSELEYAAKRYAQRLGVAIGINRYDAFPHLDAAVSDAERMKTLLLDHGFDDVELQRDDEATKAGILNLLEQRMVAALGERDLLVVFFAGHGVTVGASGYIVPRDATHDIASTGISVQRLKDVALRTKARQVVFLVDACFSGSMFHKRRDDGGNPLAYWKAIENERTVEVITAGGANETVIENGGWGVFTRRLHEGLQGGADKNRDRVVTGREIASFVEAQVIADTGGKQHPQWGNLEGVGTALFWNAKGLPASSAFRSARALEAPELASDLGSIWEAIDRKQYAIAEKLLRDADLRRSHVVFKLLLAEVYLELDARAYASSVQRELDRIDEKTLSPLQRRVYFDIRERVQRIQRGTH